MGSQFQHLQTALYTYTRLRLHSWDLNIAENGIIPIENVQAWFLLAIYEILQVDCQRGWISAGRCIRLVYLLKLHEVDSLHVGPHSNYTAPEIEDRRKVSWNAYCLDHYGRMINGLPLTLKEEEVCQPSGLNQKLMNS